jgi:G3E family GTPase
MVRLVIVGGFLGAGKTTLLTQAARRLTAQGYRVGIVTNDQGNDLVDTAFIAQGQFPIQEVAGGCFCCSFPDLIRALGELQTVTQPDVILAEPVGSCTDLVSTVLRPLSVYYSGQFELAPLTILLDGSRNTGRFSETVNYLYNKQLAEAEIIALNKVDLLSPDQQDEQLRALGQRYPQARLMRLSAHTGTGLDDWLNLMLRHDSDTRLDLDLDYGQYAAAEAELGWLNAHGLVRSGAAFSASDWTLNLLNHLAQAFASQDTPIAHIKTHVTTPDAALKASLTQAGLPMSWDLGPEAQLTTQLDFILNARVSADPPLLEQAVLQAIEAVKPDPQSRYYFSHFECFRPLPPRPTHRLTSSASR